MTTTTATDSNTGRTGTVVDTFEAAGMDLMVLESPEWGRWSAIAANVTAQAE